MTIEIKKLTLGLATTNAYLVGDTETGDAVQIDPVDDAPALKQLADDAGWTIKLILATHAHFDHVLASRELKALTGAPFAIHTEAVPMLKHLPETAARFGLPPFPDAAEPDRLLTSERETIQLGALKFETLYTPGHAPGHLSFFMPDQRLVFSGDALFYNSVGRTDLPGGSSSVLLHSIQTQLLILDDDVRVLSGHGQETTIGRERLNNPFLRLYR
ncbi:MAG: MBL fold metallo-hydrolase [Chloroflexota bacterium]|nr:MBL fold metallo-hydrolase [Chloroflexota bacterium]